MVNKENEKDSDIPSSKKDLNQQLSRLSEIKTKLVASLSDFDLTKKNAEKIIASTQKEISDFVEQVNNQIEEMHHEALETINSITRSYFSIKKWLSDLYSNVIKIVFLSITGISIFIYGNYFWNNGFNIDVFYTVFLVFPAILILYGVVERFKKNLETKFDSSSKLGEAQKKVMGFLESEEKVNPTNLDSISNSVENLKHITEKTSNAFRDYIPHVDKYYNSLERENKQEIFRQTLRNSLVHYGFDLFDDVNNWIQNFSSLKNSPSEWLEKATTSLSQKMGIPSLFLDLMYYDYVGDTASGKNVWKEIKNEDLISKFIKLLIKNNVVSTKYINRESDTFHSIEILVQKETIFSLETFRSIYHQYYFDFAQEKNALINSLRGYQFEISGQVETELLKFVPSNFEDSIRKNELFIFASEKLSISVELIKISFFEHEADFKNRIKSWKKIKKDDEVFLIFIKQLINKKLVTIPTKYSDKKSRISLEQYLISKLESIDDFTKNYAENELSNSFKIFEEKKKYLLRMLSQNNLQFKNHITYEEFEKFLPLDDSEQSLTDWLSSRINVDPNIILLFYYNYIQDDRQESIFKLIRKKELITALSHVLLTNGIILKQDSINEDDVIEIRNLALLLNIMDEFDYRNIQKLFDRCNKIFSYSLSISNFLHKEKLITNSKIEFIKIVTLIKSHRNHDVLFLLRKLVENFLEQNALEKSVKEWASSVTRAVLVLLLVETKDVLQYRACTEFAAEPKTVSILYHTQLVREKDARNATTPTCLANIILEVVADVCTDYTYMTHFQAELKKGILYPNITQLVGKRIEDVYKVVTIKQDNFNNVFHSITTQINLFLKSELNYDIVLRSLNLNLVTAYMITSPGTRTRVFTEIIPTYLPDVIDDFSKTDEEYRDFLILNKNIGGGKGTRLGVVPTRMSFDTFNHKFNLAFKEAVKRFAITENLQIDEEDYVANIIRIMPSEAFFKRVIGGAKNDDCNSDDHPINIIGALLRDNYSPERNFGLVASLKSGEKATINMKNLLIELLNTRSKIFNYVEKELEPIIRDTSLFNKINSDKFDKQLCHEFGFSSLSDLCSYVYKTQKKSENIAKHSFNRVKTLISNLQRRHQKKVTEEQVEQITSSVIDVLRTWGAIIEGFSEDLLATL